MADVMADRREAPRYALILAAEVVETATGATLTGRSSDVSRTGCYIDTLQPIPIGTEVYLRISDGMQSCEVPGKVIYMHSGYGMGIFGMGVVFGNAAAEQLSAINSWLRDLAQKKTPLQPC